jgi:hypothetical protein
MSEIISTAHLMGGLGNQMFQIANATCQGWKNGIKSKFKPISFTPMQACQPTKYINNIFRNIEFSNDIPNTKRLSCSWEYHEILTSWETSIEFFGYFQSNKNFLGYDSNIKDLFSPTKEFINKINVLYPEIQNTNTLSLHIRRGDYKSISNVLPIIDKSYIDESINQNGNYDVLFIFSDDIEWVKNNLSYPNQIIISDLEDYEQLWMISMCKNNIMSNSSFSWWGSFLNKNEGRKSYVPSVWFGPDGEKNFQDIYLEEWIKIDVSFFDGNLISKNK